MMRKKVKDCIFLKTEERKKRKRKQKKRDCSSSTIQWSGSTEADNPLWTPLYINNKNISFSQI